jgi:hypothetical protein
MQTLRRETERQRAGIMAEAAVTGDELRTTVDVLRRVLAAWKE